MGEIRDREMSEMDAHALASGWLPSDTSPQDVAAAIKELEPELFDHLPLEEWTLADLMNEIASIVSTNEPYMSDEEDSEGEEEEEEEEDESYVEEDEQEGDDEQEWDQEEDQEEDQDQEGDDQEGDEENDDQDQEPVRNGKRREREDEPCSEGVRTKILRLMPMYSLVEDVHVRQCLASLFQRDRDISIDAMRPVLNTLKEALPHITDERKRETYAKLLDSIE